MSVDKFDDLIVDQRLRGVPLMLVSIYVCMFVCFGEGVVYERMREQMIKKYFGFCDSRSGGGTVKLWDSICRCIKARI